MGSNSRPTPRLTFDILFWFGGKPRAGVPGCEKHGKNTGFSGKQGVWWKTQGLENTGRGKHGVWWKTRDLVENTGCQWKTWGQSEKHAGTIISPKNEVSSST